MDTVLLILPWYFCQVLPRKDDTLWIKRYRTLDAGGPVYRRPSEHAVLHLAIFGAFSRAAMRDLGIVGVQSEALSQPAHPRDGCKEKRQNALRTDGFHRRREEQ